ncbi:protealysin inhibitor emfourin [Gordonia sp. NPDC003585]|uniref:protealysin inhibitor emfourin n=1 Tax=Gordonia sp. NPDC003585 TaxID=3154275 RepID=UPI0033B62E6D
MATPVHIEYRRSGGLAGIDMTTAVDSHELSPEYAGVAADLIANESAPADTSTGVPDGYSYELTLTEGSESRVYRWQDPHVPEAVRPLLDALAARARPAPPR